MNMVMHYELKDSEFRQISRLAYQVCRINLHQGKKELVRARLSKRMRNLGLSSFREYIELVDQDRDELTQMIDFLSTNLTAFFRESRHFEYLEDKVIPAVAANPAGRFRFWSAGCSSGEEAYSLAMLLNEQIPDVAARDILILASDISTRMLDVARRGAYPEKRLHNVSPVIRRKYFEEETRGGETFFHARPQIRDLIKFRYLNLMEAWPMKNHFDVIFCRNVMIYFDKQTQGELVRRFHDALKPGGRLIIGHSESLVGIRNLFGFEQSSVYRKGGAGA